MSKLIFIIGIAMAIAMSSCTGNKKAAVVENSSNRATDEPISHFNY